MILLNSISNRDLWIIIISVICFALLCLIIELIIGHINWKKLEVKANELYESKTVYSIPDIKEAFDTKNELYKEYEKQPSAFIIHNKTYNKYYVGTSNWPILLIHQYFFEEKDRDSKIPIMVSDYKNSKDEFEVIILKSEEKYKKDLAWYFMRKFNSLGINGYNWKIVKPSKIYNKKGVGLFA